MSPLGWRRCLTLLRPAKSLAYKLIKGSRRFNDNLMMEFSYGEIEFRGNSYKIIEEERSS